MPLFNQIMHEETSTDFAYYKQKYEKVRKSSSQSLQTLRPFNDLRGPLDIERRFWQKIRGEKQFLNFFEKKFWCPKKSEHFSRPKVFAPLLEALSRAERLGEFLMQNRLIC